MTTRKQRGKHIQPGSLLNENAGSNLSGNQQTSSNYENAVIDAEKYLMENMTAIPIAVDSRLAIYKSSIDPNQENMQKIELRYFKSKE